MTRRDFLVAAGVSANPLFGFEDHRRGVSAYSPAVYFESPRADGPTVSIFPSKGKMATVRLPYPIASLVFGADGTTLYAKAGLRGPGTAGDVAPRLAGILRIDLIPLRISELPGTASAWPIGVCSDPGRLFIAERATGKSARKVDLFAIDVRDGARTKIFEEDDFQAGWSDFSFSSDGSKAVAKRFRSTTLEILNFRRGSVTRIPGEFSSARWSPSGEWIAALDWHTGRVAMLGASGVRRELELRASDVYWSPDSDYLLGCVWRFPCGLYSQTFVTTDVRTGRMSIVGTSRCRIVGGQIGWVSNRVFPV